MNLFEKLKNKKNTPSLLAKKGHFVVDDYIGISLLTALNYVTNGGKYLLVVSNLYKAQKIYSLITSFINKDDVLYLSKSSKLTGNFSMTITNGYKVCNDGGTISTKNLILDNEDSELWNNGTMKSAGIPPIR